MLATGTPGLNDTLADALAQLETAARTSLEAEGFVASTLTAEHWIDARYQGQSFELAVEADGWDAAFHAAHEERYGYQRPDAPVEAVTLRVVVTGPPAPLTQPAIARADGPPTTRTVTVVCDGGERSAEAVWRTDLRAGHELDGPVIIQEYSGTTWVPTGWRVAVDEWGSLHLTRYL